MPLVLGRVDVSRLDFVRSSKHVLAKRGMMSSYSTEISTRHSRGIQCCDKPSRFLKREFIGLANQLGYGKQYQKQILAIGGRECQRAVCYASARSDSLADFFLNVFGYRLRQIVISERECWNLRLVSRITKGISLTATSSNWPIKVSVNPSKVVKFSPFTLIPPSHFSFGV